MRDDHDRDIGSRLDRRLPDLDDPDRAVDDVVSEPGYDRRYLREPIRPLMGDQHLEFRYRFGRHRPSDYNAGIGTSSCVERPFHERTTVATLDFRRIPR